MFYANGRTLSAYMSRNTKYSLKIVRHDHGDDFNLSCLARFCVMKIEKNI